MRIQDTGYMRVLGVGVVYGSEDDFDLHHHFIGSVLAGAWLGTQTPPCKNLKIDFTKEAVYRMLYRKVRLGGWGLRGRRHQH